MNITVSGRTRPVFMKFSVKCGEEKNFRPDLRSIANELAKELIAQGFVITMPAERAAYTSEIFFRFGVFCIKPERELP